MASGTRIVNRVCPRCGSEKTSEILWGMPAFSDELEQAMAEKKIVLGGCCVTDNDPIRYCRACRKKYGAPYAAVRLSVEKVSFNIGGYSSGYHEMCFSTNGRGGLATHRSFPSCEQGEATIEMDERAWDRFVDALFRCLVMDWKRKYADPGCLDGTQWGLMIESDSSKPIRISGSNNYPPLLYWQRLLRLMSRVGFGAVR